MLMVLSSLVQVTCLQFSGSRIVSGSDDNTLKVWNAITGKVGIYINGRKPSLTRFSNTHYM